ncbi:MAG: DUF882 domain-containing protein [Alphaproteobacteria bacterium]|nr:DUF882 domain-containing protein [Alphaproteobacteria bacterium]MDX5370389.1 DUF882 domain-containing protein [Alphaproteobacteria bacterium]MDX5464904.1 DUF882 domain-containing protein [Alphaproteobacteria bacterium]
MCGACDSEDQHETHYARDIVSGSHDGLIRPARTFSRRGILAGIAGLGALSATPAAASWTTTVMRSGDSAVPRAKPALPEAPRVVRGTGEKRIALRHLHTGESVNTVYWAEGRYIDEGLDAVSHLMRDFRTDEVVPMAPELVDLLHDLRTLLDTREAYAVLGGYRSPKTNKMLRSQSRKVAKNSLHMRGLASDLRLPGRSTATVRKAALAMERGGVGFYPRSDFVHLDVGPVRTWRG